MPNRNPKAIRNDPLAQQDLRSQDRQPQNLRSQDRQPQNLRSQDRQPQNLRLQEQRPQDLRLQDRQPQNLRLQEQRPQDLRSQDQQTRDRRFEDRRLEGLISQDRRLEGLRSQDRQLQDLRLQDGRLQDLHTQDEQSLNRRHVKRIVVRSGSALEGTITVGGAKNSVLKLMAATLLAEGEYRLRNVPRISDVDDMADLLRSVGCSVSWSSKTNGSASLIISVPAEINPVAPYEIVEKFRASIVVFGPMLARCGQAQVALPGGDDFGPRPIDMHVRGLVELGAKVAMVHGNIEATADNLTGARVVLEFPSVGATENLLMAAVVAKGTTVIDNAAREPEIADLCDFLRSMGASISGAGSSTLQVDGVSPGELQGIDHTVIPDRIEAATYLMALGIAGGELTVASARQDHMVLLCQKLSNMGMIITGVDEGIRAIAPKRLTSVDCSTLPYPGVATDYQPFIVAALATADGVGIVTENLFAGRFRYVDELRRMGADIRTDTHHAVVRGVKRLSGAPVRAHDIRAGAALAIAGLGADGTTVLSEAHHVARGYEDLPGKLAAVGANIHGV